MDAGGIPNHYRWKVENLYYSPLIRAATVFTASTLILNRFSWAKELFSKLPWKSTVSLAGVATILALQTSQGKGLFSQFITITKLNRIVFEFLLTKNVIKNQLRIWEWTTEIESGVYLSALPLEDLNFKNWLINQNISVLAIVEPFEINTKTLVGRAIDYSFLEHSKIFAPDFLPLTLVQLHEASNWIQSKRDEGKKVLVHCKSGVGRSASALAAYYVKHQNQSAEGARKKIAEKRPVIYKEGSNHDRNVTAFAAQVSQRDSDGASLG